MTGHREQLHYSLSPQKMSQVLDAAEGEVKITAEKEDDIGVGSTERNVTSGKRLHVTKDAVSTAEKDVVNESVNESVGIWLYQIPLLHLKKIMKVILMVWLKL